MAASTTRHHGIIDLPGTGAPRPRGCQWDESVCTAAPEYKIELGGQGGINVFCPRHYALALARLAEVHLAGCPHPAAEHVGAFGRI